MRGAGPLLITLAIALAACSPDGDSVPEAATRCDGPTIAATWAETFAEASAHAGTTAYGDPARTTLVTPGETSGEPAFSPDGRLLAVGVGDNPGDGMAFAVTVVDVATGRTRIVARPASLSVAPAWSPDGRWIAYAETTYPDARIGVVGRDGRADHTLVSMPRRDRQLRSPVWSRDGRIVYFLVADGRSYGPRVTEVWSVPASGGRPRRVAEVADSVDRIAMNPSGDRLLLSPWYGASDQLLGLPGGKVENLRGPVAALATWSNAHTITGYDGDVLAVYRLSGNRLRRVAVVPGFRSRAGTQRWFGVSVRRCAA